MNPRYRYRLYILTLLILIGTGVLMSTLFEMQIEKQEYFKLKYPSQNMMGKASQETDSSIEKAPRFSTPRMISQEWSMTSSLLYSQS